MTRWTRANLRHIARLFRFGKRPAVTVYESIGSDFFLAPAPGWLNLGWWEGGGDEAEAATACERLVERIAQRLPRGGDVLDVANGLGAQDPVIDRVASPRLLVALNITEMQLRAGRSRLSAANAHPVCGDATMLPVARASFDGLISVEAAFHFPSRAAFFAEAFRVLRSGGVLTMSDITAERRFGSPSEIIAGVGQMRFWGIRRSMLHTLGQVVRLAEDAGFQDVHAEVVTARVLDPAIRLTKSRLAAAPGVPRIQVWGARRALRHVELLRRRGFLQYVLLTGRRP